MPEKLEEQCERAKAVEPGHDYMATPIYMLKGEERMRHSKDHSKGFLQINDDYFWHGFDPHSASKPCACIYGGRCNTKSKLGKLAKENANIPPGADPVDVFEQFCDGAAIIGGPNKLQNPSPKNLPMVSAPSPQTEAGGGKWKRFWKRKI